MQGRIHAYADYEALGAAVLQHGFRQDEAGRLPVRVGHQETGRFRLGQLVEALRAHVPEIGKGAGIDRRQLRQVFGPGRTQRVLRLQAGHPVQAMLQVGHGVQSAESGGQRTVNEPPVTGSKVKEAARPLPVQVRQNLLEQVRCGGPDTRFAPHRDAASRNPAGYTRGKGWRPVFDVQDRGPCDALGCIALRQYAPVGWRVGQRLRREVPDVVMVPVKEFSEVLGTDWAGDSGLGAVQPCAGFSVHDPDVPRTAVRSSPGIRRRAPAPTTRGCRGTSRRPR